MKPLTENTAGRHGSSAKVIDGKLILSLFDAVNPIVWTFDLGQARASALEVRPGSGAAFSLVSKMPKGEANEIASYDSKTAAVEALVAVSHALESADHRPHTHIHPVLAANESPAPIHPMHNPAPYAAPAPRRRGWLGAVIGLLVVVVALYLIFHIGPRPNAVPGETASAVPSSGAPAETGTPVSADSFLQQQH